MRLDLVFEKPLHAGSMLGRTSILQYATNHSGDFYRSTRQLRCFYGLRTTGGTELIATWLSNTGAPLPAIGALALLLAAAMAVTPFLNNAATVLVVAPIAARFAEALGYRPEAFLMAVAIGAGFGAALGVALHHLPFWLSLGCVGGIVTGIILTRMTRS